MESYLLPILAVATPIVPILLTIIACNVMSENQESQRKDPVSEPIIQTPVKKPVTVTAEQVLKRSVSANISKQYHTDAIAMVKVIEQSPSKNKFVHSAIMFDDKIIDVSKSKYQLSDTEEIKSQQLNDVIQIVRKAINCKISSIQIAYCLNDVKSYIDDLPKNNPTALAYVQELNDLAKYINIVFVSEGLSDINTFSKLSTYLSKNLKDPTITKKYWWLHALTN